MGALIAVSLAPLFTFLIKPLYTVPVAMLSLLIILRHKDNIATGTVYKGLIKNVNNGARDTAISAPIEE
jgi:hypothetical protein